MALWTGCFTSTKMESTVDENNKRHTEINGVKVSYKVYKKKLKALIGNKKGYKMKRF